MITESHDPLSTCEELILIEGIPGPVSALKNETILPCHWQHLWKQLIRTFPHSIVSPFGLSLYGAPSEEGLTQTKSISVGSRKGIDIIDSDKRLVDERL